MLMKLFRLFRLLSLLVLLMTAATGAWAQARDVIVYDFEAAATAGENPAHVNGSVANGTSFYGWESADKPDSKRQDYTGYEWTDGSILPKVCHVWRRVDRIYGNVADGGLKCPNNREMAIDGLMPGDKVTIVYSSWGGKLLWAIGDGTAEGGPGQVRATATINGVEAVTGQTTIASGAEIVVNSVTPSENGTGYIVVRVLSGMVIKKVTIQPATYTVSMAAGTTDAASWTAMVGNATDPSKLPLDGVIEDQDVTLHYDGNLDVKSITAKGTSAESSITVFELNGSAASIGTLAFGSDERILASTVKIHNNGNRINAIKIGASYDYDQAKYFTIKPETGSFKKGDKISIAICINTEEEGKEAKAVIYDKRKLLYTTANGINGRNSNDDPVVETYVLSQDADILYIGRKGNTNAFVTTLKVVRPVGPDVTWDANNKNATFKMFGDNVELQVKYEGTYVDLTVKDDDAEQTEKALWTGKFGDDENVGFAQFPMKAQSGQKLTAQYDGTRKVKSVRAVVIPNIINLSELTENDLTEGEYIVPDGATLTGTLQINGKITIAEGATVTLDGVDITELGISCAYAGISCPGDATLILKEGSVNTVYGGLDGDRDNAYPGIWIAPGKTLTIQGAGKLVAYCGDNDPYGAGIGAGYYQDCGNIEILGGDITATGGKYSAGIGGSYVNNCGTITIANTVTRVQATAGDSSPRSIGAGSYGTCGTVNIGGTEYTDGVTITTFIYPND